MFDDWNNWFSIFDDDIFNETKTEMAQALRINMENVIINKDEDYDSIKKKTFKFKRLFKWLF